MHGRFSLSGIAGTRVRFPRSTYCARATRRRTVGTTRIRGRTIPTGRRAADSLGRYQPSLSGYGPGESLRTHPEAKRAFVVNRQVSGFGDGAGEVSKASKIRRRAALCPRALIVLDILQLIFGLGELAESFDDGPLDTFFGSLYICFGILAFWRIRITALLTVITQAVLIPGWLILLIGDTIENGALRHMRPLILTFLGILSFIGSIDILRYVRSLSPEDRAGQRALQSRYFPRIFRPEVLLAVVGSFVSRFAGLVAVLMWVKIHRDRGLTYPW